MSRPYKMNVVLRFSDHRDLTDVLKEKVERELRDNLRAGFGDLVQVEVARTHPRLKEIEEKGLQALDSWKDVTGIKTHFVLIDYVDNSFYEIRARQHDGYTGQVTPVIRRERTNSRDFLARKISLVLDGDFGVVGEVTNPGDENTVEVTLKGAGLDAPLSHWVRPGDVFSLVEIVRSGSLLAQPVPFAVLQAQDLPNKNGVVKCRFFKRHVFSFRSPTPGNVGFRCIKLGTTKAPLVVRLVEYGAKTPRPLNGFPIEVQRLGFEPETPKAEENATNTDGFTKLLGKDKPFENLAFVIVRNPPNSEKPKEILARVPVPIVDDRPVTLALSLKKEASTPWEFRQRFWMRRINERLVTNRGIFAELNKDAPQAGKLAATLERAKIAKVELQDDIQNLKKERQELVDAAQDAKIDLSEGDQRIQLLERDTDELEKFIDGQENVVRMEKDPARREAKSKWEEAKALEREKDYDQAIKLYDEAQNVLNDAGLANYIAKLKAAWKPKSDAHAEARAFTYKDWPEFDADRMKERIAKARTAFDTCKKAGDHLTPQKLLRVALSHSAKLKEILDDLNPNVNADQEQPYKDALAALNELAALNKDVTRFLKETLEEK